MANNPLHKKNLKPFEKGTISNPNGRGKGVLNAKTRLLRLLELTQKKENPFTGEFEDFSIMEQMDMAQIVKALKGDVYAYRELLDRLEGKVTQPIEQNFKQRTIIIDTTGNPDTTLYDEPS